MDSSKLVKMNSAELEKEIATRQKKIKTLKSEITLLEKLRTAENAKNAKPQTEETNYLEGQQAWPETV